MPQMTQLAPPRDSLELASLASSNHEHGHQEQIESADSSSDGISSSRRLSFADPDPRERMRNERRSYSVSSAFDFNSTLFPLSTSSGYTALGASTTQSPGAAQSLERNKSLTYFNGLSLVIGLIIGSGIFSSPASVNTNAGSIGAALIVWVVAGLLAWTGAASYAELGGAIPLNGGAQVYLSKIFAEWVGFIFTWTAVSVLKPGSAAIIAIIFGEYAVQAILGAEISQNSVWLNKSIACAGLIVVTLLNCISTRLGARSADVFMLLKFAALLAVAITGIVVATTGWSYHAENLSSDWRTKSWFEGTSTSTSQWAVALYAALWGYDGWDNTNYVVGEMINPTRDLPRTLHTALPVVMIAYVLANLAYIFVLPASVINQSNTVAVAFGSTVYGPVGSLLLALAVSGSCFGALNATTFTSGRLVYAAGKEGYLPSFFGITGLTGAIGTPGRTGRANRLRRWFADESGFFDTPVYAMLLNGVLTIVYIIIGDFTSLTTFYGIASYLFYFLAVIGLIVLRVTEPDLERPYKCWLITPIIFCCVSLFLVSRAIFAKPIQALVVIAFLAAGLPLYWWQVGRKRGNRRVKEGEYTTWQFWRWWRR
ncbi:hypothetical protein AMS68_007207 [Peltaster fructicola]|uniref:Amino acid permease/ SLC12A domain-containing protein n=1 Tax=Peltaster fructicola TaxID=286661 RepID=A0A6H0Y503_9PEZI|nr:hypothetical protein AMS68_007207 [Peltaster fructicola]